MYDDRSRRAMTRTALGAALAMALAMIPLPASSGVPEPTPSEPAAPAPAAPEVRDSRTNLQSAFTNEVNAKERYLAAAQTADREGYPWVARLFRACARSEEAQADRHVQAIAWSGGEAKAVLERVELPTTAENLRAFIEHETYEVAQFYPALLARARSEHQAKAVRSMNLALSADREHLRLLESALGTLDQRIPARAVHVCPFCGKTVETLDFDKCRSCFTPASKFVAVL
jgi:rubrerythrin